MTKAITELALFELLSLGCRIAADYSVRYYNAQGQLHREYGPAIEYTDGSRAWLQNGQLHRLDGPAVEWPDGRREWWQNGHRHRLDGPAVEYVDGSCEWYINGKELTRAEWLQVVTSMENVWLKQWLKQ